MTCPEDCWLRTYSPQPSNATADAGCGSLPSQAEAARKLFQPIKPWQIRILCIEPAERLTDPLICQLETADIIYFEGVALRDSQINITYDALSYAWGSPNLTDPLLVNGIIYPITTNLSNALRALRYPQQRHYLWADAICINQQDDDEKSVQVRRMTTIFWKARSVIAWLGLKEECGYNAIDYLLHAKDTDKHRDECMLGLYEIRKGLQELCTRPWFRRTWVRQEVFMARILWIRSGETTVSWWKFLDLPKLLESITNQLRSRKVGFTLADFKIPTNMQHLRRGTREEIALINNPDSLASDWGMKNWNATNLLGVLAPSSHFDATNPRDFVYGVLGMTYTATRSKAENDAAAPVNVQALPVDYSKSVAEVFQDVVKYVINRYGSLDVLYRANGRRGDDLRLPSWTPDWRYAYDQRYVTSDVIEYPEYCDEHPARVSASRQSEVDVGVLRISGLALCQITETNAKSNTGGKASENYHQPDVQGCAELGLADGSALSHNILSPPIGLKPVDLTELPLKERLHYTAQGKRPRSSMSAVCGSGNNEELPVFPLVSSYTVDSVLPAMLREGRRSSRRFLVPTAARDGDLGVVLWGSVDLWILRPKGAKAYELIGRVFGGQWKGGYDERLNLGRYVLDCREIVGLESFTLV